MGLYWAFFYLISSLVDMQCRPVIDNAFIRHLFFQYRIFLQNNFICMGACLAASSKLRDNDQITHTMTIDQNMRAEIQEQLQKPIPIQKQKVHPVVKQPHQQKSQEHETSSQESESSKENKNKIEKPEQNIQGGNVQKNKKKVLFKNNMVNKVNQKQPPQKPKSQISQKRSLKEISDQSDSLTEYTINNKPEQFIENAYNKVISGDENMIGKGLTEEDNKLILLTKNSKKPIQLNEIKLQNGSIYKGFWMEGKRHGFGLISWRNGGFYQGDWVNNFSEGKGKIQYVDGSFYIGNFVRNMREGKGVYTKNNIIYDGQWKNDMQQGKGVELYGKGQKYDGLWHHGHKNGYGQLFFEGGSYYKGDFCQNQIHGYGVYNWEGVKTYAGYWQNNLMSGKGILTWKNGVSYQGIFKMNKMNGIGRLQNEDGSISQGFFENGKKQGLFIEICKQGKEKNIEYYMGKKIRPDYDNNGSRFQSVNKTNDSKDSGFSKTSTTSIFP